MQEGDMKEMTTLAVSGRARKTIQGAKIMNPCVNVVDRLVIDQHLILIYIVVLSLSHLNYISY